MYSPWLWDSIKFQAFPKLATKPACHILLQMLLSAVSMRTAHWIKRNNTLIGGSDCFIQQSMEYKLVDSWNLTTLLVLPLSVSLFLIDKSRSLQMLILFCFLLLLPFTYSVSYFWKELLAWVDLIHIIKILFALISNWFYYSQ